MDLHCVPVGKPVEVSGPEVNPSRGCVCVVDDDGMLQKALSRLLLPAGYEVRNYLCAEDFLGAPPVESPACLLLDLHMPGMHGLGLQRALADSPRKYPVIFLSGSGDVQACAAAMKMGAVDFLTKPCTTGELFEAVERALQLDREAKTRKASRMDIERRLASLTARERQVLQLVVEGRMNKQIAFTLGCAEKTVKVHRGRIMDKMVTRSLAELVRIVSQVASPER